MEIAAPAVLVGKHVAVAGGDGCSRGGIGSWNSGGSQHVAGFAPIEARVRDENLNSADEQRQEADGGDPVGDTDYERVPQRKCCGWRGRTGGGDPDGIGHFREFINLAGPREIVMINTGSCLKGSSFAMAVVLTATLLWGGCLSCAQYLVSPSISAKTCCMPSGHCEDKGSKPSSTEECRTQLLTAAETGPVPAGASIPVSFVDSLPALVPASTVPARLAAWGRANSPNHFVPPDLCLLHSVFRV